MVEGWRSEKQTNRSSPEECEKIKKKAVFSGVEASAIANAVTTTVLHTVK
jgi:hypothetical protein